MQTDTTYKFNLKVMMFNILCILLFFSTKVFAITSVFQDPNQLIQIEVKTNLEKKNFKLFPHEVFTVNLAAKISKDHKAYVDQFKIEVVNVQDFKISSLKISNQKEIFDKFTKKNRHVVEDNSEIQFTVEAPPRLIPLVSQVDFALTYQICSKTYCLLPTELKFQIPFDLSSFQTEIKPEIETKSLLSVTNFNLEQSLSQGLLWTLILIYILGVITSFTPCIFPMIPITLTVLTQAANSTKQWKHFLVSVIYVLGICITFSSLGFFAAKTGGLFGSLISHPVVLTSLCILFLVMSLSMFGFFEISLPSSFITKLNRWSSKHGLSSAFLSGLVSGIVASPCVGPILVSILAFVARNQNSQLGFLLLFVYALGMGTIFLVLGLSSRFVHKLPKSGPWLKNIKKVIGILMLFVFFFYANILWKTLKPANSQTTINSKSDLNWQQFSEISLKQNLNQKKPIMIDIFADWCVACHELEEKTFSSNENKKILHDKFIIMKFDATKPSEELEKLQKLYGFIGLPTVVFLDENGNWLKELTLNQFEESADFNQRLLKVLSLTESAN